MEIQHHGILGQKWGIQNGPSYPLSREQRSPEEMRKNGSISDSGKERYGKDGVSSNPNSKSHSGLHSVDPSKVTDKTKASLVKNASNMTNDELRAAINRMNNENTLKQLLAEQQLDRPKYPTTRKQLATLAGGTASLASSIAKIRGDDPFAAGMKDISEIAKKRSDVIEKSYQLENKSYQRQLKNIKKNIDLSNMSDDDIRLAIDRYNLEKSYSVLTSNNTKNEIGREAINDILETANIRVNQIGSITGIIAAIKRMRSR